ncbi:unnamed protein product [Medioppia subpectinata]|uniref:Uncharacterized protein n=1 Tax=Medioppia subpectinata TaxID=1979941 RepID=A0A7R9L1H7_9ACAR|nr:unnamed protein product [Medioppia subpectinata]CAG2113753.1 unnamed protein product [Medioppia subpectinata]
MSTAELKQIQQMSTPIETRIINRALNVFNENYFDFTYTGMYSEFTKLMVKVRDQRSHVFIASEFAMDFYTKQTETFGYTVHMARDEYFDRPYGFLIHKDNADSILAIQLNQIRASDAIKHRPVGGERLAGKIIAIKNNSQRFLQDFPTDSKRVVVDTCQLVATKINTQYDDQIVKRAPTNQYGGVFVTIIDQL